MFIYHLLGELPEIFLYLKGHLSEVDIPTPGLHEIRDCYVNISARF